MESYRCRTCNGDRTQKSALYIHEVCPTCAGDGGVDWITHAMGGKSEAQPSLSFQHSIMQRNIHYLVQEIKNQGLRVGIRVDVDVRYERESDYYHQRMMQVQPLIFPPGG